MGGTLSFNVTDSPTTPGLKSIVSDEISGVDADKLLESMEKYIRAGKTISAKAADASVTEKDGGILVKTLFKIPEMFGGGEMCQYSLFKIDKANTMVSFDHFPTEFFHEKNQALSTGKIKVLSGPVRIEYWQDAHEVRASGRVMQAMLNKVLEHVGAPQTAKSDQPSISAEGQFSAVTDVIESGTVTPDSYLDGFRQFLVEVMNATELPDGSIIEERSGVLGDLLSSTSYAKHIFKPEECHLYCHEYGDDESMTEEIGITHVLVHKDPFRVEQWNMQKAQRLTGNAQKKTVEEFVKGVLEYMQES